jgi:hypothetical protein
MTLGTNGFGGGIFSVGPTTEAVLIQTTVTGNHVTSGGGGLQASRLKLSRSLIAGNYCDFCTFFNTAREAGIGDAEVDDFNLFGQADDAGITGFTLGERDIVGGKALKKILGPLQDNGGATLTHALVPGSPALDAAPVDANCPATDQRGVTRPQGAACDIGAVEGIAQPPPPPPQSTEHNFVVTSVKTPKSIKHGGGTAPVAVTIRNAGTQSETLSSSSVLGDGVSTGLVRLGVNVIDTDGEQCEPATISLNSAKNAKLFGKGAKVLTAGASLTVNFLVTYRCDAPLPVDRHNPELGDFSNSASVFPDELDGISDSDASGTLTGVTTKVTP